jgi:hypothetical protein
MQLNTTGRNRETNTSSESNQIVFNLKTDIVSIRAIQDYLLEIPEK